MTTLPSEAWILICSLLTVINVASSQNWLQAPCVSPPLDNIHNTSETLQSMQQEPKSVTEISCISSDPNIYNIIEETKGFKGNDYIVNFYLEKHNTYTKLASFTTDKHLFHNVLMKYNNWMITGDTIDLKEQNIVTNNNINEDGNVLIEASKSSDETLAALPELDVQREVSTSIKKPQETTHIYDYSYLDTVEPETNSNIYNKDDKEVYNKINEHKYIIPKYNENLKSYEVFLLPEKSQQPPSNIFNVNIDNMVDNHTNIIEVGQIEGVNTVQEPEEINITDNFKVKIFDRLNDRDTSYFNTRKGPAYNIDEEANTIDTYRPTNHSEEYHKYVDLEDIEHPGIQTVIDDTTYNNNLDNNDKTHRQNFIQAPKKDNDLSIDSKDIVSPTDNTINNTNTIEDNIKLLTGNLKTLVSGADLPYTESSTIYDDKIRSNENMPRVNYDEFSTSPVKTEQPFNVELLPVPLSSQLPSSNILLDSRKPSIIEPPLTSSESSLSISKTDSTSEAITALPLIINIPPSLPSKNLQIPLVNMKVDTPSVSSIKLNNYPSKESEIISQPITIKTTSFVNPNVDTIIAEAQTLNTPQHSTLPLTNATPKLETTSKEPTTRMWPKMLKISPLYISSLQDHPKLSSPKLSTVNTMSESIPASYIPLVRQPIISPLQKAFERVQQISSPIHDDVIYSQALPNTLSQASSLISKEPLPASQMSTSSVPSYNSIPAQTQYTNVYQEPKHTNTKPLNTIIPASATPLSNLISPLSIASSSNMKLLPNGDDTIQTAYDYTQKSKSVFDSLKYPHYDISVTSATPTSIKSPSLTLTPSFTAPSPSSHVYFPVQEFIIHDKPSVTHKLTSIPNVPLYSVISPTSPNTVVKPIIPASSAFAYQSNSKSPSVDTIPYTSTTLKPNTISYIQVLPAAMSPTSLNFITPYATPSEKAAMSFVPSTSLPTYSHQMLPTSQVSQQKNIPLSASVAPSTVYTYPVLQSPYDDFKSPISFLNPKSSATNPLLNRGLSHTLSNTNLVYSNDASLPKSSTSAVPLTASASILPTMTPSSLNSKLISPVSPFYLKPFQFALSSTVLTSPILTYSSASKERKAQLTPTEVPPELIEVFQPLSTFITPTQSHLTYQPIREKNKSQLKPLTEVPTSYTYRPLSQNILTPPIRLLPYTSEPLFVPSVMPLYSSTNAQTPSKDKPVLPQTKITNGNITYAIPINVLGPTYNILESKPMNYWPKNINTYNPPTKYLSRDGVLLDSQLQNQYNSPQHMNVYDLSNVHTTPTALSTSPSKINQSHKPHYSSAVPLANGQQNIKPEIVSIEQILSLIGPPKLPAAVPTQYIAENVPTLLSKLQPSTTSSLLSLPSYSPFSSSEQIPETSAKISIPPNASIVSSSADYITPLSSKAYIPKATNESSQIVKPSSLISTSTEADQSSFTTFTLNVPSITKPFQWFTFPPKSQSPTLISEPNLISSNTLSAIPQPLKKPLVTSIIPYYDSYPVIPITGYTIDTSIARSMNSKVSSLIGHQNKPLQTYQPYEMQSSLLPEISPTHNLLTTPITLGNTDLITPLLPTKTVSTSKLLSPLLPKYSSSISMPSIQSPLNTPTTEYNPLVPTIPLTTKNQPFSSLKTPIPPALSFTDNKYKPHITSTPLQYYTLVPNIRPVISESSSHRSDDVTLSQDGTLSPSLAISPTLKQPAYTEVSTHNSFSNQDVAYTYLQYTPLINSLPQAISLKHTIPKLTNVIQPNLAPYIPGTGLLQPIYYEYPSHISSVFKHPSPSTQNFNEFTYPRPSLPTKPISEVPQDFPMTLFSSPLLSMRSSYPKATYSTYTPSKLAKAMPSIETVEHISSPTTSLTWSTPCPPTDFSSKLIISPLQPTETYAIPQKVTTSTKELLPKLGLQNAAIIKPAISHLPEINTASVITPTSRINIKTPNTTFVSELIISSLQPPEPSNSFVSPLINVESQRTLITPTVTSSQLPKTSYRKPLTNLPKSQSYLTSEEVTIIPLKESFPIVANEEPVGSIQLNTNSITKKPYTSMSTVALPYKYTTITPTETIQGKKTPIYYAQYAKPKSYPSSHLYRPIIQSTSSTSSTSTYTAFPILPAYISSSRSAPVTPLSSTPASASLHSSPITLVSNQKPTPFRDHSTVQYPAESIYPNIASQASFPSYLNFPAVTNVNNLPNISPKSISEPIAINSYYSPISLPKSNTMSSNPLSSPAALNNDLKTKPIPPTASTMSKVPKYDESIIYEPLELVNTPSRIHKPIKSKIPPKNLKPTYYTIEEMPSWTTVYSNLSPKPANPSKGVHSTPNQPSIDVSVSLSNNANKYISTLSVPSLSITNGYETPSPNLSNPITATTFIPTTSSSNLYAPIYTEETSFEKAIPTLIPLSEQSPSFMPYKYDSVPYGFTKPHSTTQYVSTSYPITTKEKPSISEHPSMEFKTVPYTYESLPARELQSKQLRPASLKDSPFSSFITSPIQNIVSPISIQSSVTSNNFSNTQKYTYKPLSTTYEILKSVSSTKNMSSTNKVLPNPFALPLTLSPQSTITEPLDTVQYNSTKEMFNSQFANKYTPTETPIYMNLPISHTPLKTVKPDSFKPVTCPYTVANPLKEEAIIPSLYDMPSTNMFNVQPIPLKVIQPPPKMAVLPLYQTIPLYEKPIPTATYSTSTPSPNIVNTDTSYITPISPKPLNPPSILSPISITSVSKKQSDFSQYSSSLPPIYHYYDIPSNTETSSKETNTYTASPVEVTSTSLLAKLYPPLSTTVHPSKVPHTDIPPSGSYPAAKYIPLPIASASVSIPQLSPISYAQCITQPSTQASNIPTISLQEMPSVTSSYIQDIPISSHYISQPLISPSQSKEIKSPMTSLLSHNIQNYDRVFPPKPPLYTHTFNQPTPGISITPVTSNEYTERGLPIIPYVNTPDKTIKYDNIIPISQMSDLSEPMYQSTNKNDQLKANLIDNIIDNDNYSEMNIPVGNFIITKKDCVNSSIETINPSIGLKTWTSNIKLVEAKLVYKFKNVSGTNFAAVVRNTNEINAKKVETIVTDYIRKKYGDVIIVQDIYSLNHEYEIIRCNLKNNNNLNLLWPINSC